MSGRGVPLPGRSGEPSRDISQYSSTSAFTQASDVSQTSSFRELIQQNQNLEDELSRSLENQLSVPDRSDPVLVLKRLLSTRSAISTSSSLATQNQAAIGHDVDFREIGTGSIGQVYEQPGTVFVYKCAILDRSEKIWNNYKMHTRIQEVFDRVICSKAFDVEIAAIGHSGMSSKSATSRPLSVSQAASQPGSLTASQRSMSSARDVAVRLQRLSLTEAEVKAEMEVLVDVVVDVAVEEGTEEEVAQSPVRLPSLEEEVLASLLGRAVDVVIIARPLTETGGVEGGAWMVHTSMVQRKTRRNRDI